MGRSCIGQPSDVGFYDPGNASNPFERVERRLILPLSVSASSQLLLSALVRNQIQLSVIRSNRNCEFEQR